MRRRRASTVREVRAGGGGRKHVVMAPSRLLAGRRVPLVPKSVFSCVVGMRFSAGALVIGAPRTCPGRVGRSIFTREYVASHCSVDRPLHIDFFSNFCGLAGWLKLAEHSEREWFDAQSRRAQAAFAHLAGTARHTHRQRHRQLCIYYRGLEREVGHTYDGQTAGHPSSRTSELESIHAQLRRLGAAAVGADGTAAAQTAPRRLHFDSMRIVSMFADAVAGAIVPKISGLPPLATPDAERPSSLCVDEQDEEGNDSWRPSPEQGGPRAAASACLDEAIRDIGELSRCDAILIDAAPHKISSFLLVATMIGGLSACPTAGGLLMPLGHCAGAGNHTGSARHWQPPFHCGPNWWSVDGRPPDMHRGHQHGSHRRTMQLHALYVLPLVVACIVLYALRRLVATLARPS